MRTWIITAMIFALGVPLSHATDRVTDRGTVVIDETIGEFYEWGLHMTARLTSGDFGGTATARTVYVPFKLTRYFEQGDVSFTFPFVNHDAPGGVKVIRGTPYRVGSALSSTKTSNNGLADVLLSGRYYWLHEETDRFNVSPVGILKLPTADDDENLGTGAFDATIGFETSKTLDEKWSGYFDIFYSFLGDPDGFDIDNQFLFRFGAGYQLAEETLVSLYYQQSTALVDGEDSPIEFIIRADQKVDPSTRVFGDISLGMTDGAPDFGLTGGVGVYF